MGSMDQEKQESQAALMLKKLRVSAVFKSLLFLLGVFAIQFVASMLCMIATGIYVLFVQGKTREELAIWISGSLNDYTMVISLLYAVIAIVIFGISYLKCQWREHPFSYRKALGGGRIPGAAALGFGTCIILTVIVGLASQAFPGAFVKYQKLMESLDVSTSALAVYYIMLSGPVAEELIFRGVILDQLRPAFPFWVANGIQAALFGVFHMNLIQGLYAFVLGMILGMVAEAAKTVVASMITHIIFNSTSTLLGMFADHFSKQYNQIYPWILLAAVICFWIGMRYYIMQWRRRDGGISLEK